MASRGIRPATLQLLALLDSVGPMSAKEIATARDRGKSATHETLAGVLGLELVRRTRESWRRGEGRQATPYEYTITRKGQQLLQKELARRDGSLQSALQTHGLRDWWNRG